MYKELNRGRVQVAGSAGVSVLTLPAWGDERIRLAMNMNKWMRQKTKDSRRDCSDCYAGGKETRSR